jgi:putative phosphoribosyl transferase
MALFKNRQEAAAELTKSLTYLKEENPLILCVPNSGVPIAAAVAETLEAPLDILLIAKLTAPGTPHDVVGAVDEHGRISMIETAARWHQLTAKQMVAPAREAFTEIQHRRARLRAILPESDVRGRTVIVVDHGVETGATMLAAVASLRDRGAAQIIAAAPAGGEKATWQLHEAADKVVIPHTPSADKGIAEFYEEFVEIPDRDVEQILQRWSGTRAKEEADIRTLVMRVVVDGERVIHCEMDLPPGIRRGSGPWPAVIFAHALESDGRNRRALLISNRLAKRGVICVRPDFTGHGHSDGTVQDATPEKLLADLLAVYENIAIMDEIDEKRVGLRGSGTGAVIALHVAAERPETGALVLRGPWAAGESPAAPYVKAPTLLIHSETDAGMKAVEAALTATHESLIIPESDRVYNDPISVELMASATVDWLADHLQATPTHADTPEAAPAEMPTVETNPSDPSQAPAP